MEKEEKSEQFLTLATVLQGWSLCNSEAKIKHGFILNEQKAGINVQRVGLDTYKNALQVPKLYAIERMEDH